METRTLVDALHLATKNHSDRTAFRFLNFSNKPDTKLSYGELWRQTENIASHLQDQVQNGDRVVLLFEPGLNIIPTILACFCLGAIAIPAYPPKPQQLRLGLSRLRNLIEDANPRLLICSNLVANLLKVENAAATLHNIVRFGRKEMHRIDFKRHPIIVADKLLQQKAKPVRFHSEQDIAFLQYSSGSTGNPKGVIITHENLLAACRLMNIVFRTTPASHMVSWLPVTHNLGLIASIFQTLYAHSSATLFSPLDFVADPKRWFEAIDHYHATASGGPQFAYDFCVNRIQPESVTQLDLSSWQYAGVGGERVVAHKLENFAAKFACTNFNKNSFVIGYGLSETTVGLCSEFSTEGLKTKEFKRDGHQIETVVSCGKPLPEHKAIIIDPTSKQIIGDNQVGEIWCQGPCVAPGYWQNGSATEETFSAYTANGDGPYMRTGDLGFRDDESYYVIGRLKELIIIHGKNFAPTDIEQTIEKYHPEIRQSGCIAFSYIENETEVLGIACELNQKIKTATKKRLIKDMCQNIRAEFGVDVTSLCFLQQGDLPRTANQKLQRLSCKKLFLEGKLAVDFRKQYKTNKLSS